MIPKELSERIEALAAHIEEMMATGWTSPYATASDLRALLTAAQGQEWRDIASAPRDFTEILATDGDETWIVMWERGAGWWNADHTDAMPDGLRAEPTHWMPLPPPPQAEGERS